MVHKNGNTGKVAVADAALALFAEKGVLATTTRDIARKAGVAEGTIYRHYKDKDSLAAELFRQGLVHLNSYLRERLQQQKSMVGKFRVLVQSFFDFAQNEPTSYSYIMFGHYTQFHSLPSDTPMPRDIFAELIRDGMDKGILQMRDANLSAAMVIGALERVIFFKNHGIINEEYEQIVPQVAEACMRMLSTEDIWAAECC